MNSPKHADFTLSDRQRLPLAEVHIDTGPRTREELIEWWDNAQRICVLEIHPVAIHLKILTAALTRFKLNGGRV